MTDEQITQYLEDNGYPTHVVRGGRPGLIARWREFVEEVERGYRFGIEDYRNDLDLRGVIEILALGEEVADADERLQQMLIETDKRVWESAGDNPFWDFGYPKNATGDLKADLKAEGLL